MSSYFSLPSFARAKAHREQLRQSNPQNPLLNDEDERFLKKQIESEQAAPEAIDEPATKIGESGEEREEPLADQESKEAGGDQVVVPEERPDAGKAEQESKRDETKETSTEDSIEQMPEGSKENVEAPTTQTKKPKKIRGIELPSQEEAEAATRNFNVGADKGEKSEGQHGEKRTWVSYLPRIGSNPKKDEADGNVPAEEPKKGENSDTPHQRTWANYASSAYSSIPSVQSLSSSWHSFTDKDSKAEPVYNEDGTINEEKTKEKEEREVSVLLDQLNMSSINNRVFSFSGETQRIYERFAQVLKDTMNGAPTAYEDMEKLMKEAGPQLEKQFHSLPPFVQTLVKSLPAKLGTTLGPELMAAASEKPGADMKARTKATRKRSGGSPGLNAASAAAGQNKSKRKRKIPGLRELVTEQGAVATALRNVVNFLRVRFPFLASTTNVVMSLAVSILMFVFWYCHKRGKETRLAKEAAAAADGESVVDDASTPDAESSETNGEEETEDAAPDDTHPRVSEKTEQAAEAILSQPEPSQVPLPDSSKGE